ncbi:MAG: hypothetical protein IPK10_18625 [Bacteroidetes bacterium]|nr:hypothetical protein [Bacteroidota bacterium]
MKDFLSPNFLSIALFSWEAAFGGLGGDGGWVSPWQSKKLYAVNYHLSNKSHIRIFKRYEIVDDQTTIFYLFHLLNNFIHGHHHPYHQIASLYFQNHA